MAFDENESEKMPQAASPPGRHYLVQLPPMEHARAAMRATKAMRDHEEGHDEETSLLLPSAAVPAPGCSGPLIGPSPPPPPPHV